MYDALSGSLKMKQLDFLIIGAQKAGTTSLYMYIEKHPDIYMPRSKEANFFGHDNTFAAGWESFAATHFLNANPRQKWGCAPPQCMIDAPVPARISEIFPEIKLIAILRDPIERAISHCLMSKRRGRELRSMEEALWACLDPERIEAARRMRASAEAETECYVAWGEYGRILREYSTRFDSEQMLVLTSDALSSQTRETVRRVFSFVGVDPNFAPDNLDHIYHVGGAERVYAKYIDIINNSATRLLWRTVPGRLRRRLFFWWDTNDVKRDNRPRRDLISPSLTGALVKHYTSDVSLLTDCFDLELPWPDYGCGHNQVSGEMGREDVAFA